MITGYPKEKERDETKREGKGDEEEKSRRKKGITANIAIAQAAGVSVNAWHFEHCLLVFARRVPGMST